MLCRGADISIIRQVDKRSYYYLLQHVLKYKKIIFICLIKKTG